MNTAIEVVIFTPRKGVDHDQLTRAAHAIEPAIHRLPGFVRREFGASEDGKYIDIVHWQDLASAKAAAENIMELPECGAFFSLIDEASVQMLHFNSLQK